VVLDSVVKHPFALALFEDRLFWSDWENKDIVSCNKFTGKDLKVHVKEVGVQPFGLTVTSPALARRLPSPCLPSPCSHLCLPAGRSARCLCPAHLALAADQKTCAAQSAASTFLLAAGRSLYQLDPRAIGLARMESLATLASGQVAALATNGVDAVTLVLATTGADSHIMKLDGVASGVHGSGVRFDGVASGSMMSAVAYDPRTRSVFWTDVRREAVMGESLVTGAAVQVVAGLTTPLALLLVPGHNRLVVGEPGRLSALRPGPGQQDSLTVLSTAVQRPSALAYSAALDAVFVGDTGARTILRFDWAEPGQLQPVMKGIGEVTGIAVQDNLLYWTEKEKAILFWVTLTGPKEVSWMPLSEVASATDVLRIGVTGNNSQHGLNLDCLTSRCSDFCVPKDAASGATCGCPYGMELAEDELTCHGDCPDTVFSCGPARQCVPKAWRCDGAPDCTNGADEVGCSATIAPTHSCNNTNEATCDNGDCLHSNWWCDGDIDCTDGSDEGSHCPAVECGAGRSRCKDGMQCVLDRWRCDGDTDCWDESDEADCGGLECRTEEEFACGDGLKCIQSDWRCDGTADCHDGSDEGNCTYTAGCRDGEFGCGNGNCVGLELLCDGEDDCGDGSDEQAGGICPRGRKRPPVEELLPLVTCRSGVQVRPPALLPSAAHLTCSCSAVASAFLPPRAATGPGSALIYLVGCPSIDFFLNSPLQMKPTAPSAPRTPSAARTATAASPGASSKRLASHQDPSPQVVAVRQGGGLRGRQ
jgi:hypothetical protein